MITELDKVVEGFQFLKSLGATGLIAEKGSIKVVGARSEVPLYIKDQLEKLGFNQIGPHWIISV